MFECLCVTVFWIGWIGFCIYVFGLVYFYAVSADIAYFSSFLNIYGIYIFSSEFYDLNEDVDYSEDCVD